MATLYGTSNPETLAGTSAPDSLYGNDTIVSGLGNEVDALLDPARPIEQEDGRRVALGHGARQDGPFSRRRGGLRGDRGNSDWFSSPPSRITPFLCLRRPLR